MVPMINYINFYSRDYPVSLLSLWGRFVKNLEGGLSLHTGLITSSMQFQHKHFWFISLLLTFFIVFTFLHDAKKRWLPNKPTPTKPKIPTTRSILLVLGLVSILTALITFLIYGIFHGTQNKDAWITIGSLIQFGIVTLTTIFISYLTSQYLIRPFPKISVAGMITLFVPLLTVLNPTAS